MLMLFGFAGYVNRQPIADLFTVTNNGNISMLCLQLVAMSPGGQKSLSAGLT